MKMAKEKKAAEAIKQKELQEYYERKQKIADEEKILEAQRQGLIDRKGLGASIETGPFVMDVEHIVQERTDNKKLFEIVAQEVGEEKATKWKTAASKTTEYDKISVKKLI